MKKNYVFDSLGDQLDPRNLPPVPLRKVPAQLHGFPDEDRVKIYLQMATSWPLCFNLKLPPVFQMFAGATQRGELNDTVHTVCDSSSGNTAAYEAMLALSLGKKVMFFVRKDIAEGKEKLLRDMGNVTLIKCAEGEGDPTASQLAALQGQEKGYLYLQQYGNFDNVQGHLNYHLLPAWNQLAGKMMVYAGGIGTGGHVLAARNFSRDAPITVVAAYCAENNPLPGIRPISRMTAAIAKECLMDSSIHKFEVFQAESYRASDMLAAHHLDVGPTTGAAFVSLLDFLRITKKDPGAWARLRNSDGDVVCVVMAGDRKSLYGEDRYRLILDSSQISSSESGLALNYAI